MRRLLLWILSSALLMGVGCGSSVGAGPCDGDASVGCGGTCNFDSDCDPGFYCRDDAMCWADCTPDGNQCSSGQVCDDRGRCVVTDGDGGVSMPDALDCPGINVNLTPTTPTVVLLIDQSGSMTADFGGKERYTAVRDALVASGGVVEVLQDRVRFGATLYTSEDGDSGPMCPILQVEAPDLNNLADITTLLDANVPEEDTPTGESIDAVVAEFAANPPPANSPPIIIVATDGEPDTCAVPDPQNGQPESVAAAMASFSAGIELFILSVGDGVSDAHLQDMANAGVGLPIGGMVNAPFYVADNQGQVVSAINDIITGVRDCVLTLDGVVDTSMADQGIVILNGETLVFGTDWQLIDSTTLELIGQACTDFLTAEDVILSAEFPCGTVVL